MQTKKYKIGDRVFYECVDGSIETSIVLGIEDREYNLDNGKTLKFQMLRTGEYTCIENYNCIPLSSPKIKELRKQYALYEKNKTSMIKKILDIMSPFNDDNKLNLLEELKYKIELKKQLQEINN